MVLTMAGSEYQGFAIKPIRGFLAWPLVSQWPASPSSRSYNIVKQYNSWRLIKGLSRFVLTNFEARRPLNLFRDFRSVMYGPYWFMGPR